VRLSHKRTSLFIAHNQAIRPEQTDGDSGGICAPSAPSAGSFTRFREEALSPDHNHFQVRRLSATSSSESTFQIVCVLGDAQVTDAWPSTFWALCGLGH
jgi:hypothetical protein